MSIFLKALDSATFFHLGQLRNDGKPYITHPVAVSVIVERMVHEIYKARGFDSAPESVVDILKAIAVYHDVWEDQKKKGAGREQTLRDFAEFGQSAEEVAYSRAVLGEDYVRNTLEMFVDAVELLTKPEGEGVSYFEYLKKIKASGLARLVKLADLEHNLSDLKPGKLRDKYLLAQYFLTH